MIDARRWEWLDEVFAAALELPPAQRPAFLDEACRGDAALRGEVERLLAADQAETSFLESPPGDLLGLALDSREEGGRLGPYRLLRRIGSGGMGAVYLARREDEHYQRDVAVKVLRSGLASTEAFHRFLAERQILAHLEHPNIARLYDGGSTRDGRPYLVLELIDGVPVDQYCDRHRLSIGERLALFQKVCAAVQHAHQNLLVHRDLKPGNILITPVGEPKLIDFGIAKRLAPEPGAAGETRDGVRLLTPSYASPEQVQGGAITTASDVYSLGVVLYELLAGRRPFPVPEERPYEVVRALCESEPERPSAAVFRPGEPTPQDIAHARRSRPRELRRRLQGDLDNIVLMALRKEPRERYGSAAQLAEDLARHLQNLPVTARRETLRYRTRKFLRRNRAAVAVAAALILLTAAFVTSLMAQQRHLARERDKARYALTFLVDTFKQADPYQTQGERLTAREILDQGAARVSRELAGQPDLHARLMDAIGEANLGLGRHGEALPLLERALELRYQAFGPGSLEVAESLEHLAACHAESARRDEAEAHLREALAIRRRRQGDRHPAVARTLNQLGRLLAQEGAPRADAPEIEALHQEALAIARGSEGPVGLTVAESLLDLAGLRSLQGRTAEAERLFREGLAIEREVLGEGDPRLYRHQSRLGTILIEAGKLREAEALLRACLATQREMLGRDHPDALDTLNNLAVAVHLQGRYAESEPLNREALTLFVAHFGPDHLRVASAHQNLATDLEPLGRVEEAVAHYHQALAIRRRTVGEGDPSIGQILLLLAELHRYQEDYPRALDYVRQAQEAIVRTRGPEHPHLAYVLRETGRIYSQQRRFREAEPYLRRSLVMRRESLDARHPDLAKSQVSLARCLIGLGRDAEAVPLLREAQVTFAQVYGPDADISQVPGQLLAEIAGRRAP